MILIHSEMTKEQMLDLLMYRDITINGLKQMCRFCQIDDSGLKPEPIRKRLLQHFAGDEVEPTKKVRGGVHLFGSMGS